MKISKHAEERSKERNGFNKKTTERMAKKALEEGISHNQLKGNLKKWVDGLYLHSHSANNIKLYGDKAYLFHNETLITILQIPSNLTKNLNIYIKK